MTNAEVNPAPEDRRSSLYSQARKSFVRSSGERGASAEVLRGSSGADFESNGKISRGGGAGAGCVCIFGGKGNGEKFILLKGPFCFVFKVEKSPAPLYAINLVDLKAESKGTTALLQSPLGDTEYELQFETAEIAARFSRTVDRVVTSGQVTEVRKRLGHNHLLKVHKSMRFAESIALKKLEDAPSKEFDNSDVLALAKNLPPM